MSNVPNSVIRMFRRLSNLSSRLRE